MQYVYETFFRRRPELQGKGVFVEFGAEDGVFNSNTYFFEKVLKWRGVLVEVCVHPDVKPYTNQRARYF
jgi:hypothetical protein